MTLIISQTACMMAGRWLSTIPYPRPCRLLTINNKRTFEPRLERISSPTRWLEFCEISPGNKQF